MQETRKRFHEELAGLETDLHDLGDLAAIAVRNSVEALVKHDDALAHAVIDEDDPSAICT